ncbi:M16 family metallopeptidase [Lentibacillus saliphilus]|uniref:M16 family metallopeptidase n=1 Tax=Lentibacillus saliphilus TaxID=2737028 RepID=UPI001C31033D|nr:pitrilysin family protein [Lentibacillus saliphilus]
MLKKHICQNGVTVINEHVPAVRSVTIGIWIAAGSRYESTHNNGISHFLEHMLFKGTKTRTAQDIAEAFDAIGGQVNAFTSKEYTCFYAKVMDTYQTYAVDILADMFFNSVFDEAEVEREKNVVLEEIKMYEDTPDDIVHDLLAQASYGQHPLAYPILGTEAHVQSFTSDLLKTYMKERYTPENVVISVAGNVSDGFEDIIEAHFGHYSATSPIEEHNIERPQFLSEHIVKPKHTEQAHLCLGFNGLSVTDDDIYSLMVMNNVLGGSMSSRLFQDIREKQGLAYAVFSYHSSFLDHGLLTIYAGTGRNQLNILKEKINQTIDQFKRKAITDKELANSKEQLKGNLLLSLESTNSRMSRNGKNELLLKKHRTIDDMLRDIEAVNHQTVQTVIERVFTQNPSSALVTATE